jgi:hypothetical protein
MAVACSRVAMSLNVARMCSVVQRDGDLFCISVHGWNMVEDSGDIDGFLVVLTIEIMYMFTTLVNTRSHLCGSF